MIKPGSVPLPATTHLQHPHHQSHQLPVVLNASVDKAEDRNAKAETDIDYLLATANLKRTEPGEDASDRG